MGFLVKTKFEGRELDGVRRYYKGGGSKGPSAAQIAKANADERARRVTEATSKVDSYFTPTFTDDWYGQQRQKYLDFYMPQLGAQRDDAFKQMSMNLAQANPYGSSAAAEHTGKFNEEYENQYNQIISNADDYVAQIRKNVEESRLKALQGAGDNDLATMAQQAASQAKIAAQTPTLSPLGQLFANMVNPVAIGASGAMTNGTMANDKVGSMLTSSKKGGAVKQVA